LQVKVHTVVPGIRNAMDRPVGEERGDSYGKMSCCIRKADAKQRLKKGQRNSHCILHDIDQAAIGYVPALYPLPCAKIDDHSSLDRVSARIPLIKDASASWQPGSLLLPL